MHYSQRTICNLLKAPFRDPFCGLFVCVGGGGKRIRMISRCCGPWEPTPSKNSMVKEEGLLYTFYIYEGCFFFRCRVSLDKSYVSPFKSPYIPSTTVEHTRPNREKSSPVHFLSYTTIPSINKRTLYDLDMGQQFIQYRLPYSI